MAAPLAYAATRPDTFRVERSARLGAPPEDVYPHLADFRRWAAWSPWERLDPEMSRTHGGAQHGVGATYGWEGNKKVGRGKMEIIETVVPSRVVIQLDFIAPWEAHNVTELTLAPDGGGTRLTWEMHGPLNYMMKLMGVFMSMDRMVGRDFERGLANLAEVVEREGGAAAALPAGTPEG